MLICRYQKDLRRASKELLNLIQLTNRVRDYCDVLLIFQYLSKEIEVSVCNRQLSYIAANYENVEKLATIIYAPYKFYVGKYESYEEGALTGELNSIRLVILFFYPMIMYLYSQAFVSKFCGKSVVTSNS